MVRGRPCAARACRCAGEGYPALSANANPGQVSPSSAISSSRCTLARTDAAATETERRSALTAQRTGHGGRCSRASRRAAPRRAGAASLSSADRGAARQRGGHAERVDLLVAGLADRVALDPGGELCGKLGTPPRGQPLGVGQPIRRGGEPGPRDDGTDHDRPGPGAAAHLVDAGHPCAARRRELTLDHVPGHCGVRPGGGGGRIAECQLLHDSPSCRHAISNSAR